MARKVVGLKENLIAMRLSLFCCTKQPMKFSLLPPAWLSLLGEFLALFATDIFINCTWHIFVMFDKDGFLCISSKAFTVSGTVGVFLLDLKKFANGLSSSPLGLCSCKTSCVLFCFINWYFSSWSQCVWRLFPFMSRQIPSWLRLEDLGVCYERVWRILTNKMSSCWKMLVTLF